jgi:hypothetical protein
VIGAHMTARLVAFPPSPQTAHRIARHLRGAGFYTLPDRVWSNVADLAEVLADAAPTPSQLIWLWQASEAFLAIKSGKAA